MLISATFDGGSVAQIHPVMDLDAVEWSEFFLPLAELVAAAHPEAEWTARPLADEISDKEALTGHAH